MTFYSISYLESQGGFNQVLRYVILAVLLLALIAFSILYMHHRLETKYRQLGIIAFLLVALALVGEYSQYKQSQSASVQNQQMISFIQKVAKDEKVPADDVLVNSRTLNDRVIVKVRNKYYQTKLSSDRSAFQLYETHLMSEPKVAK
ncbi:hypothetical protein CRD60_05845 [Bifidobacterium aemilianum]|uniref:DUF3290 domain-containing protein n=1 Tax=Bifidobacterium aemilianum TaxID=2493120 RepID=A0A366K6Z6_9BIFI|nr:DUF3290 domain-containing protein [Bifidobacterium aemilianum]RBP97520.1 hypothetical protein CRD60_05845 [Bifidobacterium aemilianum]